MSGWQRIGVVLSVLWIIGSPLFIWQSENSAVREVRAGCYGHITDPFGPQWDAAVQHCAELFPMHSFADLYSRRGDAEVLWALTLIPIAILWIVGGIVIGTLRWIGRGFGKSQKTPAPTS
jgi:hypothetical protein